MLVGTEPQPALLALALAQAPKPTGSPWPPAPTSTLAHAEQIGITLVVSTAMPLGKEGPMVHIGSIIGSGLSRVTLPFMREQTELRSPKAQRLWVGMGAAAGVAAAFNAPVGGILYSFEEVCSHWSASMTWRSFVCAVVVAASSTFLNEFGGALTLLTYSYLTPIPTLIPTLTLTLTLTLAPSPTLIPPPNPTPNPGLGHGDFVIGLADDSRFSFSRADIGKQ